MYVWKMKLQKLLFSLGHVCVWSNIFMHGVHQVKYRNRLTDAHLQDNRISQLPHMSHASENLLC